MPSPINSRTLAEVRAECQALGITPGRSIAECERRLSEKRQRDAEARARCGGRDPSWKHDAPERKTIMAVTTPGAERNAKFAEAFAQAAIAEAPDNPTPEEEQAEREAMAEYSAEMRRMDEMGEAAWMAEQFKPRLSRMARMLCDTTAICGTLARNPLIYGGDQWRFIYAHRQGVAIVAAAMSRGFQDARGALRVSTQRTASNHFWRWR